MSDAGPDPNEFHLPRRGWLCRMSKGFDFEACPGFEPEMWSQDALYPPYLFIFEEGLTRTGQGEEFLLAHKKVKSCWEAWEIHEALFPLQVTKRAALEVIANAQVVVYVSHAAALEDLAANYPGNQLLLQLSRDERPGVREAARAVLAGEPGAVEELAVAAEAVGDSRAQAIRQLRHVRG